MMNHYNLPVPPIDRKERITEQSQLFPDDPRFPLPRAKRLRKLSQRTGKCVCPKCHETAYPYVMSTTKALHDGRLRLELFLCDTHAGDVVDMPLYDYPEGYAEELRKIEKERGGMRGLRTA